MHRVNDSLFVATVRGVEVCRASVAVAPGLWEFYSTVTRPEYEGRGHAARVVRFALDAAAEAGVQVVASCWYVDAMMDRWSPEYDHLRAGRSGPVAADSCRIAPAVVRAEPGPGTTVGGRVEPRTRPDR